MARITTSRVMFQRLAHERLSDARALYASRNYSGAYYLAGYSVECALKSVMCRRLLPRHTLPDREVLKEIYQHDLVKLLSLSGLQLQFNAERLARPALDNNWNTIKDWKETSRYKRNKQSLARDLIAAVGDGPDSFMAWVLTVW